MRLSSMKAAHAAVALCCVQEIRVKPYLGLSGMQRISARPDLAAQAVVGAHPVLEDAGGRNSLQPHRGTLREKADRVPQPRMWLVHDAINQTANLLRAGTVLLVVSRFAQCCRNRRTIGPDGAQTFRELAILS